MVKENNKKENQEKQENQEKPKAEITKEYEVQYSEENGEGEKIVKTATAETKKESRIMAKTLMKVGFTVKIYETRTTRKEVTIEVK